MGREIRRVPPNWEHPKTASGNYLPMFDKDFDTALQKWLDEYSLWKKGKHPYQLEHPEDKDQFWEFEGGPPDPESCRPAFTEEPTWYQVYETVSEGTPVTPPFPTKEELVNYLVEHGTFWDDRYAHPGWDRSHAESFVNAGWSPSGWITTEGKFMTARDGYPENEAHQ